MSGDAGAGTGPGDDGRAESELARDRRVERLLVWKGVAALLAVVVVIYVRQRYFV